MIITLFIVGILSIIFGIHNLAKEKNILAVFFIFMGVTLLLIGYFVVHLYPQTLPEFLRTFKL